MLLYNNLYRLIKMGGIFGKPAVVEASAINDTINRSILKIASQTTSTNTVTQLIEASGSSLVSGNKQIANIKTNMASVLNATQQSSFTTTVKNDLTQELKKESVALLGALDGLTQNGNTDLKTKIENSVENLNLMELTPICTMSNQLTQSIIVKEQANIINNSQEIQADFTQSCTTIAQNNMSTMSDMANAFNQRAVIKSSNPLDFLTGLSLSTFIPIALVLIAVVIGFTIMVGAGKFHTLMGKNTEEGNLEQYCAPETMICDNQAFCNTDGTCNDNSQCHCPEISENPDVNPSVNSPNYNVN